MSTPGNHIYDLPNKRTVVLAEQSQKYLPENGHCCGANGICTHEVLRDGEHMSNSGSMHKTFVRKVTPLLRPKMGCGSCDLSFNILFQ